MSGRDQVAVADRGTGHWILVPGDPLGGYRAIASSPAGQSLSSTAGNRRLLGRRSAAERAVPLQIAPEETVMSTATATASR